MRYQGQALAALGRLDALRALTDEILAAAPEGGLTPADALLTLALEARAHGHRDASLELANRGLAWLDARSESERSSPDGRGERGQLLEAAERWREAASAFATLAGDRKWMLDALGASGVLAARQGLADSARAFDARLAALGRSALFRARIAAVLGDREQAVALLRQAFSEGANFGVWLHADMDLESLRGYPPFEALLRPKE
jgi:tetratricopeptide (TPR) repeat protein